MSRVEKAVGIGRTDILRGVMNGAMGSIPVSGRLTDHLAIGVLAGLIHRDIVVDDVIRECGKRENGHGYCLRTW